MNNESSDFALLFFRHFDEERKERSKFILYLKIMLPIAILLPVIIVLALIGLGVVTQGIELAVALITAMLSIPASIFGVLKIISGKLFEDKYRTELLNLWLKRMNCAD
jgi:hypothetical protein